MRNKRYIARGLVGAPIINLVQMDDHFIECVISLEFYSDDSFLNASKVVPSAGTVTVEASETGVGYGTVVNGTDIDIAVEDYTRVNFLGHARFVRATPTAIAGATHYQMTLTRK